MSNAAVINATATTGRNAGSPVTIVTDGTITPKAYSKGSGAYSATLAFAPVVGGVTGAPITLTVSSESPASVGPSTKTDATQWVGWALSSTGDFEVSGIVEGVSGDDSLSGYLGIYADEASAPQYAVEVGSTATIAGTQRTWGGAGAGWVAVGVWQFNTLATMIASTGVAGTTAKCTDPMFGPAGGMFDWSVSLAKWIPRNVRIYGTGIGTVYTASAGDINTDVQVGSLVIPESLVFAGIDIACIFGTSRSVSGAAGSLACKLQYGAVPVIELTGITQNSDSKFQGFARYPSFGVSLQRVGLRSTLHGFGSSGISPIAPSAGSYTGVAVFNAPTTGMVQTLTELYAELSYGG